MTRTRNPRGILSRAPNQTPARCYPSRPSAECERCMRFRAGRPYPSEVGRAVVIDASAIPRSYPCAMFIASPVLELVAA